MCLRKVLGAVFVSLVFLIPVYLPQYAFAACCVCNNGVVQQNTPRGCNPGCGCGGIPPGVQCITKIDDKEGEVTFEDKQTHQVTTMAFKEGLKMKVGDCGTAKVEKEDFIECTGFAVTTSGQQTPMQKQ